MLEMDLRQSGITNSAGGPSTENKERLKKVKETEDSRYIYQNELDKACFQHDMAYTGFKDLTRRTAAGKYYVLGIKVLRDEAFNLAKSKKYDEYQRGLASMVYKYFDKKIQVEQLQKKIFQINN